MQNDFDVEIRSEDGVVVISVRGELDLASSPGLEQALEDLDTSTTKTLIVDLRELEFMDSTGLSVLVGAQRQALENGQQFALVRGSHQVQRLLNLTGISDRFTLVDRPEDILQGG